MTDHVTGPGLPQSLPAFAGGHLPTLAQICESPGEYLGTLDVGTLNSICAAGLPGAEDLDTARQLVWLDEAARKVDLITHMNLQAFTDNPSVYDNSLAKFCCEFLLRTLQELLGVRYNPARIADADFQNVLCMNPDFRDSRDLFIHGMISGPGGTCASMPVMYVAVGRRMGYPLKLVEAPGHLFFRWDDPEGKRFNAPERFNVEGTGHGISFHADDFYRKFPREWTPIEKKSDWYLKSLSPAEELAAFLATRGSCFESNGRWPEAAQAFYWARKLAPNDFRYLSEHAKITQRTYEIAIRAVEDERRHLEAEHRLLEFERARFEQKARQLEITSAHHLQAAEPDHPDCCGCFHCRQARQTSQQPVTPGHPVGCGCVNCLQRAKPNPFNPW